MNWTLKESSTRFQVTSSEMIIVNVDLHRPPSEKCHTTYYFLL